MREYEHLSLDELRDIVRPIPSCTRPPEGVLIELHFRLLDWAAANADACPNTGQWPGWDADNYEHFGGHRIILGNFLCEAYQSAWGKCKCPMANGKHCNMPNMYAFRQTNNADGYRAIANRVRDVAVEYYNRKIQREQKNESMGD